MPGRTLPLALNLLPFDSHHPPKSLDPNANSPIATTEREITSFVTVYTPAKKSFKSFPKNVSSLSQLIGRLRSFSIGAPGFSILLKITDCQSEICLTPSVQLRSTSLMLCNGSRPLPFAHCFAFVPFRDLNPTETGLPCGVSATGTVKMLMLPFPAPPALTPPRFWPETSEIFTAGNCQESRP